MKKTAIAILVIGLIHSAPAKGAETSTGAVSLPTLAKQLEDARSVAEMDRLVKAAAEQRSLLASRVVMLLRTSSSIDAKARACYLLGEFRAERGVEEAISNIGLKVDVPATDKIPLWSQHPCVDALSYIGKPAEQKLIQFISINDRNDLQALALQALVHMSDIKTVSSILEDKLRYASGVEATRLKKAMEELRSWQRP